MSMMLRLFDFFSGESYLVFTENFVKTNKETTMLKTGDRVKFADSADLEKLPNTEDLDTKTIYTVAEVEGELGERKVSVRITSVHYFLDSNWFKKVE